MINPGDRRVKTRHWLCTERGRESEWGVLEGESEHSVRRVALHVLKSLSLARSLSLSLSHAQAMCGRHVTCRCRQHQSERGRRAVEGERERREGRGWRRKERGMRRAVGEETVKITERINTEDKAKQRWGGLERESLRAAELTQIHEAVHVWFFKKAKDDRVTFLSYYNAQIMFPHLDDKNLALQRNQETNPSIKTSLALIPNPLFVRSPKCEWPLKTHDPFFSRSSSSVGKSCTHRWQPSASSFPSMRWRG